MKNNRIITRIIAGCTFLMFLSFIMSTANAQSSDEAVTVVKGKVIDQATQKPIPFANVFVMNTGVGTVSNNEWEFILKVPVASASKTISISFMGYKSTSIPLGELKPNNNVIALAPQSYSIQEVIVRTNDPIQLINNALHSIPDNYGSVPYLCTAFYRESIMQNKQYVGVAEAVLNVYPDVLQRKLARSRNC